MIKKGALLTAVTAVAIAACGTTASPSSGPTRSAAAAPASSGPFPSSSGSTRAAPGHDTPEDAADGFVQGLAVANTTEACGFVEPNLQAACRRQLSGLEKNGSALMANGQVISGRQALVGLKGKMCSVIGCTRYDVPPLSGLEGTFARLYKLQTTDGYDSYRGWTNSPVAPIPCTEVDGRWYVGPYPEKSFSELKHELVLQFK